MENLQTIIEQKKTFLRNLQSNTHVVAACILGLAFILGTVVIGTYMYRIRALDNTISVSGSTREKVVSDSAKLTIKIEKVSTARLIKSNYQEITRTVDSVKSFITTSGVPESQITIGALTSFEDYNPNNQIEKKYLLSQLVTISSTDVYLLDRLAKEIPLQSTENSMVTVQSLEFFYSKLADMRVSLIGKAIEDAKARAQSLTFGGKVGKLKSAGTGVTQVVPVNSTDVSDYGTYDTSTIEKEVIITVKASFVVK